MPLLAELLDPSALERLATARTQAEQRQAARNVSPRETSHAKPGNLNGPPACEACGHRLPAPAAVFSGAA